MEINKKARLVSISEAAVMTGMSEQWWRHAVAGRKPMPPVRVIRLGGAVRIHLDDLLRFVDGEAAAIQPARRRGRPRKVAPSEK